MKTRDEKLIRASRIICLESGKLINQVHQNIEELKLAVKKSRRLVIESEIERSKYFQNGK